MMNLTAIFLKMISARPIPPGNIQNQLINQPRTRVQNQSRQANHQNPDLLVLNLLLNYARKQSQKQRLKPGLKK
jgi:hypothetical protein